MITILDYRLWFGFEHKLSLHVDCLILGFFPMSYFIDGKRAFRMCAAADQDTPKVDRHFMTYTSNQPVRPGARWIASAQHSNDVSYHLFETTGCAVLEAPPVSPQREFIGEVRRLK